MSTCTSLQATRNRVSTIESNLGKLDLNLSSISQNITQLMGSSVVSSANDLECRVLDTSGLTDLSQLEEAIPSGLDFTICQAPGEWTQRLSDNPFPGTQWKTTTIDENSSCTLIHARPNNVLFDPKGAVVCTDLATRSLAVAQDLRSMGERICVSSNADDGTVQPPVTLDTCKIDGVPVQLLADNVWCYEQTLEDCEKMFLKAPGDPTKYRRCMVSGDTCTVNRTDREASEANQKKGNHSRRPRLKTKRRAPPRVKKKKRARRREARAAPAPNAHHADRCEQRRGQDSGERAPRDVLQGRPPAPILHVPHRLRHVRIRLEAQTGAVRCGSDSDGGSLSRK
eukprot:scaffold135487_cov32-Tisochrysis_lutea.AAC.1